MAKYAKYAYLGTYLGVQNMVKWGVPEKILQNAVQTRWSQVNRTLQLKPAGLVAYQNFDFWFLWDTLMHTAQSSCWALLYSLPSLLSAALKKSGEKISSDFKPGKINFHFCLGISNLECFYWRSVRRDVILRFSEASHILYNRTKSFQLSQFLYTALYFFFIFFSVFLLKIGRGVWSAM